MSASEFTTRKVRSYTCTDKESGLRLIVNVFEKYESVLRLLDIVPQDILIAKYAETEAGQKAFPDFVSPNSNEIIGFEVYTDLGEIRKVWVI